jgi:GNAT superfamily N-acetyltransferase
MKVRAAAPEDAEAIAQVHVTTWQTAYRGTIPDDYLDALDVAGRAQLWRRGLSTGASSVVLAVEDGGAVTGFVAFGPHRGEADSGQVYALYVRPDRWRNGAGAVLMAAAERDLRERGFGTARLWAIDGNERAQGFYERCGWMPDGARRYEELGGAAVPQLRYHRLLEP